MVTESIRTNSSRRREWAYLDQNRYWLIAGMTAALGVIVFFASHAPQRFLPSNLLVLAIALLIAVASLIARQHYEIAAVTVVGGLLISLVALGSWFPQSAVLLLAPLALALLLASRTAKAAIALTVIALFTFATLGAMSGFDPSLASMLLILALLISGVGVALEYREGSLFGFLYGRYESAMQDLDQARDQRQQLNQANQNLGDALAQLQRLNTLYQASVYEAGSARRAKEEFVSRVSHELRTPLNMILGFSEMILHAPDAYGALPTRLLADMEVVHRNSKHLLQLINDVLDLSQIEAEQLTLHRSWVDVDEIVDEVVVAIRPLFQSKRLTLETHIDNPQARLYCDKLRIRQILLNLLSNAGRYTQSGGAVITATTLENTVTFAVRDTGPGIEAEARERIFEPFHGTDRDTDRTSVPGGSTGLGLSISKSLVGAHGGRIWCESEVGVGSCFYFTLPYRLDEPTSLSGHRWVNEYARRELSPEEQRMRAPTAVRERFLVVAPEVEMHRQIDEMLTEVEVVGARSIETLEEELETVQPNAVVINDARMMEDLPYARDRLRELARRLPVVTFYIPGTREACERLNVIDYLVKPISRQRLLEVVDSILGVETSGANLLLIEDNQEMARLLRRQIASFHRNYTVRHTSTGAAGLVAMQASKPDLIFLDLGLPDMDGFEVLQKKNAEATLRDVPVVILSARDLSGAPMVADRLRLELGGGLSLREIMRCTQAITEVLAPKARSIH